MKYRVCFNITSVLAVLIVCCLTAIQDFPFFSVHSSELNLSLSFLHHQRLRQQTGKLQIQEKNPVVNETSLLPLTALDELGQPISTGVTWESGSPEIAAVDEVTGVVRGVQQGFATITARKGTDVVSVFVAVVRVRKASGVQVPGDTKVDSGGRIYLSDPLGNVIYRKNGLAGSAQILAGQPGMPGNSDGPGLMARFHGPTSVAVDNGVQGGVYVADTANHAIRHIDFQDQVTRLLGTGVPGTMTLDSTPFRDAVFRGPRGVALDTGGNLFLADTENHALFYADLTRQEVRLLAGAPGQSGLIDGSGKEARFFRPAGLSLSPDGRLLAVADEGNRVVRLVTRDGKVTTIRRMIRRQPPANLMFQSPQSVSFDEVGNIYVVDQTGVQIITQPTSEFPDLINLAQPGSFSRATSVEVRGTESFVLDASSPTEAEAVKVVSVGTPEILSLSRDSDQLEGGSEVIVTGRNFAPESRVIVGDRLVSDAVVESATQVRIPVVPGQTAPGLRTLSIQTRGGIAQRSFRFLPKPLDELKPGEITTVAGGVRFVGDGGHALTASLNYPGFVASDGFGNLYIADSRNHRIRKVDPAGGITTVAGNGSRGFNGDGIPAISASLNTPRAILVDRQGNLLVADTENHRIRRIDAQTQIITTIAGTGAQDFTGDDGPALEASLAAPMGMAVDALNHLFLVDSINCRIRRVDAITGIITTMAGNGEAAFHGDSGPAINASLYYPTGVAVDSPGNIFIADSFNNRVRRVDAASKIITTFAGDGQFDFDDGGPATEAGLDFPTDVAVDTQNNLLIADSNHHVIRRVSASTHIISTVIGNGIAGFFGDNGPATEANLFLPNNVAVDGTGNVYISDQYNHRIRRVESGGIITTVAGSGNAGFYGDGGPAIGAGINFLFGGGVAVDTQANLFVADDGNYRIRRLDLQTGHISTVAGNGSDFFEQDNQPAISVGLSPMGVAVDTLNRVLIADNGNQRVHRIEAGIIKTIAGDGQFQFSGDGGSAISASLYRLTGVVEDANGNLFIADTFNQRIRKVNGRTGIISTVAGNGEAGFSGDNGLAINASLFEPAAVALDRAGNLFIADTLNNCIRRVDATTQIITTVAGGPEAEGGDGGPATQAVLGNPFGLALDAEDNLFLTEREAHRVRRVDSKTGIITTAAGTGSDGYSGDGGPAVIAAIRNPFGITVDRSGVVFFTDTGNDAIRAIKGIAIPQPQVTIIDARYEKPMLTLTGSGFGTSGAMVTINGSNVSKKIKSQTDTQLTLKGNPKKLNLQVGANQIIVTINGARSNTFVLQFTKKSG
ncbi:MAG: IPT/TIG domain-containing protein [Acidobacteria bacterium]|nr:IPT/TIG domain-containing protein [Acidobacteriota bacterium]